MASIKLKYFNDDKKVVTKFIRGEVDMNISNVNLNNASISRLTTIIGEKENVSNNVNVDVKEIVDTVTLSDEGKQLSNLQQNEAGSEANVIAIAESIAAAVQL